jgi:threonine dehydrogenase-like Zn-dependent dehydrogenase
VTWARFPVPVTSTRGFRAAISLVAANRAAMAALFSHHFPLARAAEAIEFAMSRPPDAIKIVVTVT